MARTCSGNARIVDNIRAIIRRIILRLAWSKIKGYVCSRDGWIAGAAPWDRTRKGQDATIRNDDLNARLFVMTIPYAPVVNTKMSASLQTKDPIFANETSLKHPRGSAAFPNFNFRWDRRSASYRIYIASAKMRDRSSRFCRVTAVE